MDEDKWMEMMTREEPLREELREHVVELSHVKMVKHPYLFQIMVDEKRCASINCMFEKKKKHLQEKWDSGNMVRWIFFHERPYRFNALNYWMDNHPDTELITDKMYWKIVADIWIDSENIFENQLGWMLLFNEKRPEKQFLMIKAEREFLRRLPEVVQVYRGVRDDGSNVGLSWTLEHATAKWFASRYSVKGAIIHGTVEKRHIHAIFLSRGEQEVVSEHVEITKLEHLE